MHKKSFLPSIQRIESVLENPQTYYGRFIIGPLEMGQGITVGNSLRRVLLGDLEGIAITAVKIVGVSHEFATIPGIRESVLDILLNLKQIVLKISSSFERDEIFNIKDINIISGQRDCTSKEFEKGRLVIQGPAVVQSKDLQLPNFLEVVDMNQPIATLAASTRLEMDLFFDTGKGYEIYDTEKKKNLAVDLLPIDPIFMPVKKVNYLIEDHFIGNKFQERVILEIWTNASITPQESLDLAINKLISLFSPLHTNRSIQKEIDLPKHESKTNEILVEELDLSVRAYNCLKRAQIHTISDLLAYSEEDLLEIKNFGRRSAEEVIESLQKKLQIQLSKEKENFVQE